MIRCIKVFTAWIIVGLLLGFGSGCQEHLSEGGTETTNGTVMGIAYYPDGSVAAGARLKLRPAGYLQGMDLGPESSIAERWEGKSDAKGFFKFADLKAGEYGMEINDGKAFAAWVNFALGAGPEKVNLPKTTLSRTVTLSGSIRSFGRLNGIVTYVRVFGLERIAFADREGKFVIPDLPEGKYSFRINALSPYFDSVTLAENIVSSDADVKIGDIRLPLRGCDDFICDSLAVRAILDANGKEDRSLSSVITIDKSSGRITTLKFTNLGLNILPEEVGSLTALKTLRGQGNKFSSLPQSIVNLPVLEILDLEDNSLTALPERLGEMTSLLDLKLDDNKMTNLPAGLGKLQHLKKLSLSRTPLKALPEDITECQALTRLDLTANALTTLPEKMGNLISLRSLFLDSNQLSSLPESMVKLASLDTLYLDGNHFCSPFPLVLEAWIRDASGDGEEWNRKQNCTTGLFSPIPLRPSVVGP